jgi:hypothetical protein
MRPNKATVASIADEPGNPPFGAISLSFVPNDVYSIESLCHFIGELRSIDAIIAI